MTAEEAEKVKVKYEFLIGHSFVLNGAEVIVQGLYTERLQEECDYEVQVDYTDSCDIKGNAPLSSFIASIGVAFWIKYFSTLRSRV